ncbi:MAG: carboxypeptidase-like regulatory domain-containing protein [Candidatus Aminicenantales bacterium]
MKKTKITVLVFAAICLSSVLSSCWKPFSNTHEEYCSIQGNVTEAENGSPIEGAQVGIRIFYGINCPHNTDTNGNYYIFRCHIKTVGNIYLSISKVGYITQEVSLQITSDLQTINIALERETQ